MCARLVSCCSSGKADVVLQLVPTLQEQQIARDALYRDANTLLYGDNKPSEEAIDRVVGKLNQEYVFLFPWRIHPFGPDTCPRSIDKRGKFSRKRLNEDEGDITYINERNRVFNKKVRPTPLYPFHHAAHRRPPLFVRLDRTLLRQIHCRDTCQLRARHCAVIVLAARALIRPGFGGLWTLRVMRASFQRSKQRATRHRLFSLYTHESIPFVR